jgi:hypothetical protein
MYLTNSTVNVNLGFGPSGATYLYAEGQTEDGRWVELSIQLDGKIGYRYEYNGLSMVAERSEGVPHKFKDQFKPDTLEVLDNYLLTGTLINRLGGHQTSLCLDFCFTNNDGTLEYDGVYGSSFFLVIALADVSRPSDVRRRMVKYTCKDGDAVLRGLVLGEDGKLHYAELNLGEHYENAGGIIKRKKDGKSYTTALDWCVNRRFESAADLGHPAPGGGHGWTTYPLYKDIRIGKYGKIWIDDP